MDKALLEQLSPIQAIYISKSFCELMNTQSCDCDSIIVKSNNHFLHITYHPCDEDGYIVWKPLTCFNAEEYPYEVHLEDNLFIFDRINYTDNNLVEGICFSANDIYLFMFGSDDCLILTMSKLDLFGDKK